MKIGFVLDDGLDKPDGVQQYVLVLGSWLTTMGHDVHYLVGETKRKDIPNIHSLGKNLRVRFNRNRLTIPLWASKTKIKKLLEAESFDVLHVQLPYSPVLGHKVILSAPKDVAIFGTFHIAPYSQLEAHMTRMLRPFIARSLSRFDRIFSVSSTAQSFAKKSLDIDSDILPNAVDIKSFRSLRTKKPTNTQFRLVFLGRLVERKGCAELIQALAKLQASIKNQIHLTICGSGPQRSYLEKLVEKNKLADHVHFTGFVSEEQKRQILKQADVAVFPSLGGESFGIVLVEAMASGAGVVIGGDNKGYRSVLGDIKGALVDARNTKAFAKLITKLVTDKNFYQDIYEEQQVHVKQYDVAVVGKQLLTHYSGVISTKNDLVA